MAATQPCTQSAVSPWGEAAGYPGAHCPGCVANVSQQCTAFFRSACTPEAPIGKLALMLGLTRQAHRTLVNASGQLPALLQDLAAFLLIRGPYAWLGHGWTGNGNHYKNNWSPLFAVDYGRPLTDSCTEDSARPGVFRRSWTKAEVEMDAVHAEQAAAGRAAVGRAAVEEIKMKRAARMREA